jgi:hypothetical protein
MAALPTPLIVPDLRGGMNDTDPQQALDDNEVPYAINVEWFNSTVGERRAGMDAITLSGVSLAGFTDTVHLSEWFPLGNLLPQQWMVFADPNTPATNPKFVYREGAVSGSSTFTTASLEDNVQVAKPSIYQIRSAALTSEFFFAYQCATTRNHVWDPISLKLRRTGLSQPNALASVADTAGAGTFAGVRYYRYRVAQLNGSVIIRQSEPSTVTTFTPSGTKNGALLTLPGTVSPTSDFGITHWLVEASVDNANFYKIATVVIGTTTYTDTINPGTTYPANGTLSDAIGAYLLQPNFRYVAVDGSRLIAGGNYGDSSNDSTIYWSAVANDPGVGNAERQPIVTTGGLNIVSSLPLDPTNGGRLTGITSAVQGVWYAFKYQRVYMISRTSDPTQAYSAMTLSDKRGAIEGSIIEGADQAGNPCVFFLDPTWGPSRISNGGVQTIEGLRSTWRRVNLNAVDVVACGAFYKYKRQAHWWVAVDGADSPSLKIVNQVSAQVWSGTEAVHGGFSLADGKIATGKCAATWTEWVIDVDDSITLSQRPFVGIAGPKVCRTDVNTTDDGQTFNAILLTKPYLVTGLLDWWGAMNMAILGTAFNGSVKFQFVRDWGLEVSTVHTADFTPTAMETYVIVPLDSIFMSETHALQIRLSDQ